LATAVELAELQTVPLQIVVALFAETLVEFEATLVTLAAAVELARFAALALSACLSFPFPFPLPFALPFLPFPALPAASAAPAAQAPAVAFWAHAAVLLLDTAVALLAVALLTAAVQFESCICAAICVSAALICWIPEATFCWLLLHCPAFVVKGAALTTARPATARTYTEKSFTAMPSNVTDQMKENRKRD